MTPPKPRATRRREKTQPSITDAQRVVECKLAPWGRGYRYQATMNDGSKRWLRRTTSILNNLNKHTLYRWCSQQTANYYRDKLAKGERPDYWDAVAAPEVVRDEAAELGTTIHRCIEAYLREGRMWNSRDLSPEANHALCQWLPWWEGTGWTADQVEMTVWSLVGNYAGTLDLLVRLEDGTLVLVDWKTSKELHPEYLWQAAAYAMALFEMGWGVVSKAVVVRIPKTLGRPLAHVVAWDTPERREHLMTGWAAFLTAVNNLPELEESQEAALVPLPINETTEAELEELFRLL